ncbi:Tn3 family transposase [Nocardia sp. CA-151230]|uniref:Tn3 family transposase n=1 Tax=Nocardia sp. CA-151230 TaxID=3239982 RepID=UPI003D945FD5
MREIARGIGVGLAVVHGEVKAAELGRAGTSVVLWNTVYLDHAVMPLRAQGYPVLDDDVARLSAFIRAHPGLDGHYSFVGPDLGGRPRPLRNPDALDDGCQEFDSTVPAADPRPLKRNPVTGDVRARAGRG